MLAAGPRSAPDGWIHKALEGWSLWHCPLLPVHAIHDAAGIAVGWLLGEAALKSGAGEALKIGQAVQSPAFLRSLELALHGSAGKFAAIVVAPPARVYTGPGAMLGIVFNAAEQCIASSLTLAVSVSRPELDLLETLDIPNQDHYYPFGLTPDQGVRRLLPHHYLDLHNFRPERWWPTRSQRFATASDPVPIVDAIASRLRENLENIAGAEPVATSLTAGRDSRMVLAAARHLNPKVACYTFDLPDGNAELDCRAARAIARHVHIRHQIVPWVAPDPVDLQEWQVRTGHCVAGRVWQAVSTHKQLGKGIRLSGLGGEVGRCFYWRKQDLEGAKISTNELIRRLRLPSHPRFLREAEHWLASLPVTQVPDVLDLLYIEQRLGCWAGPQGYGHRTSAMAPLTDQHLFELMLSLPWEYRFEQKLAVDLIGRLWPELLAYPFNQEFGFRRALRTLRARTARASRALGIRSG